LLLGTHHCSRLFWQLSFLIDINNFMKLAHLTLWTREGERDIVIMWLTLALRSAAALAFDFLREASSDSTPFKLASAASLTTFAFWIWALISAVRSIWRTRKDTLF
jgi:hypothetical protein